MPTFQYRFDRFVLEEDGVLFGDQGEVPLRPQAYRLLHALVREPRRVLSHEELIDRAWGVQHLSPGTLKQTISELRKALGDSSAQPRFIQTVPRRGYRFLLDVTVDQEADGSAEGATTVARHPARKTDAARRSPGRWFSAVAAAVLMITAVLVNRTGDDPVAGPPPSQTPVAAQPAAASPRPEVVVWGIESGPESREFARELQHHLAAELIGSGTERIIRSEDLLLAAISLAASEVPLEDRLRNIGPILDATMLAAAVVDRPQVDASPRATLVLWDLRTGRPGAYASATLGSDPAVTASELIESLWAWNDERVASRNDAPEATLDLASLEAPPQLTAGTLLRRLRPRMEALRSSANTRPPRPSLLESAALD